MIAERSDVEKIALAMIKKHPLESLHVLADVLKVGLERGHVSADDVKHREFHDNRIIGALFKGAVRKCGFEIDYTLGPSEGRPKSHGRRNPQWRCVDRRKAESVRARLAREILGVDDKGNMMLELR